MTEQDVKYFFWNMQCIDKLAQLNHIMSLVNHQLLISHTSSLCFPPPPNMTGI